MVFFSGLWYIIGKRRENGDPIDSNNNNNDNNNNNNNNSYYTNPTTITTTNNSSSTMNNSSSTSTRPEEDTVSAEVIIDHNKPSLTDDYATIEWNSIGKQAIQLCLKYVILYILIAIIAYSYIFEHWTIIDSIYFATVTFTTCGYGDLEPTTEIGQLFTIVFAIYGVLILGVFIGIIGHTISETRMNTIRKLRSGKQKQLLHTVFNNSNNKDDNNQQQKKKSNRRKKKDNTTNSTTVINSSTTPAVTEHDALLPKQQQTNEQQEQNNNNNNRSNNKKLSFISDHVSLMDDIIYVIRTELPEIIIVAILAMILGIREQWSITSTLYYSVMTATTTCFGDYTPKTQIDKVYCIFFLPIAVAVFGEILGQIASIYMRRKQRIIEQEFLNRTITLCDLHRMDTNNDGVVNMEEFLSFMLIALQKVDQEFINDLKQIFYTLDKNNNGLIEKDEIMNLVNMNLSDILLPKQHNNELSTSIQQTGVNRHRRFVSSIV